MNNMQKFLRKVCPHCDKTEHSPSNFWNVIKFWRYETVSNPCADRMDCMVYLQRQNNALAAQANARSISINHKCSHCDHCNKRSAIPSALGGLTQ